MFSVWYKHLNLEVRGEAVGKEDSAVGQAQALRCQEKGGEDDPMAEGDAWVVGQEDPTATPRPFGGRCLGNTDHTASLRCC